MAIQPIDLQTLFTQIDKIGKNQASQREGMQIQQALQGIQTQQKTEEQIRSVNEAQNTGEGGAERVKDRNGRGRSPGDQGREEDRETAEGDDPPRPERPAYVIRDPGLGQNIDFSG
jgi:hypothetical protein